MQDATPVGGEDICPLADLNADLNDAGEFSLRVVNLVDQVVDNLRQKEEAKRFSWKDDIQDSIDCAPSPHH
jgi:hypothetical protein